MNESELTSDEDLADAIGRGDDEAAATLAGRHASGLYDFAIRTTLDAALAATAVSAAFRRLYERADARPNLPVRTWLLSLVAEEALEGLRQRGRAGANGEEPASPLSPIDERFVQTGDSKIDPEVALWVWQAARGQRPRDYSYLDLSLRQKLAPQEVADIGSLSRTGVYALLGRLRGAFEEAFATSALYYRGREQCRELDELVRGGAVGLAPALRRDIIRHAEGCPACRATGNALPVAANVFAVLSPIEAPDDLIERLTKVGSRSAFSSAAVASVAAGAIPLPLDGSPMPDDEGATLAKPEPEILAADEAETLVTETEVAGEEEVADDTAPPQDTRPVPTFGDDREDLLKLVNPGIGAGLGAAWIAAGSTGASPPAPEVEAPVPPEAEATVDDVAPAAIFPDEGDAEPPESEEQAEEPVAVEASADEAPVAMVSEGEEPAEAEMAGDEDLPIGMTPEEEEPPLAMMPEDDEAPVEEEPGGMPIFLRPGDNDDADDRPGYAASFDDDEPEADEEPFFAASTRDDEEPDEYAATYSPHEADGGETDDLVPEEDEDEDLSFLPPRRAVFGEWAADDRPNLLGPTGAAVGAGAMAPDRIRFGSDVVGGMPPPRRPWSRMAGWFDDSDTRKTLLFAVLGGLTVLFAYLGFVLGSSIEGGGGNGGEIPALTGRPEGTAEIACGTEPTVLNQGSDATLTFDSPRLNGYELVGVNVRPGSPDASRQNVDAVVQPGKKVVFTARVVPGSAGRTDDYRLTVTFRRDEERILSECAVQVKSPGTAPSGTAAPTSQATPSPTAAVQATTPPQPTSPPAATPVPAAPTATPVPPTATPVPPTATPALCTPTPQPTPIGATPFPFPTFTPVPGPC